jgi:YNFM family putative membrane transporter
VPAAIDSPGPGWTGTVWTGHVAGSATYRRVVVALMAGGLANFSLMYFVQPLLPLLAAHYDVSAAESAHALSATTLAIIAGLMVAGPLADRVGRVAVMRWSLLASGVLGLLSAVAPTWGSLVAVRGLLGLTLAGLPVAALAYLREEVDTASHPRANATYIAGTAVGGAVGRLLPGPLALLGGWQLAAVVMSIVTLAAGAALFVLLPPARGFHPHAVGLRHVLLGTLGATRDRVVLLLCLAGLTAMGAFVGIYNAIGFRLAAPPLSLGAAAALVYLAYPVGIAAPGLIRRLSDRIGRGLATVAAMGLLALAVVVVSLPSLVAVVVGLGILTFAFLGAHSLMSGWVVDRARRRGIGTAQASSAYLSTYYLGSTVAGALATWQWQAGGWSGVETLSLALTGAALLVAGLATAADRNPRVADEGDAVLD